MTLIFAKVYSIADNSPNLPTFSSGHKQGLKPKTSEMQMDSVDLSEVIILEEQFALVQP